MARASDIWADDATTPATITLKSGRVVNTRARAWTQAIEETRQFSETVTTEKVIVIPLADMPEGDDADTFEINGARYEVILAIPRTDDIRPAYSKLTLYGRDADKD